jgi:hypothetical protein
MKVILAISIVLLLFSQAFGQREVILPSDATGWAYTRSLNATNQQINPTLDDPDFWQTWLDQNLGDYVSPLTYDGPAFVTNQQAPFFAGNVPGIQNGSALDLPAGATWQNGYFLKVINGGELGHQNLEVRMLARDGAIVYLNGQPLTFSPNIFPALYADIRIKKESSVPAPTFLPSPSPALRWKPKTSASKWKSPANRASPPSPTSSRT